MSQPPEPQPGIYLDSIGTRYAAQLHPKTGWWIQKMTGENGRPPAAYQKPDFVAACNAGIFTFQPETI